MKKKLLAATAVATAMALSACGGGTEADVTEAQANAESPAKDATEESEESESQDENLRTFENVVLAENDVAKIELVNFFAEDVNWADGKQNEKKITIKVTNKSDDEISVWPEDAYLDGEKAYIVNNPVTVASGMSGNHDFFVAKDTKPEHTALESIDDLYRVEGLFEGRVETDSGSESFELNFSIPEALGNTESTADSENVAEPLGPEESSGSVESSEQIADTEAMNLWSVNYYVDNFNQPTEDWFITTQKLFAGTFNNSVATNGALGARLVVDPDYITITLHSYQDINPDKNVGFDKTFNITMRTSDGTDHNLSGIFYSQNDRIFVDDVYRDEVLAALMEEGNITFYLENADNRIENYLFTIIPDNFKTLYEMIAQK